MKNILFIFLLFAVYSCKQSTVKKVSLVSKAEKLREININPKDSINEIDSLLEEPTFVKLETKKNFLIGNIDKILFDDSLMFIMDRDRSKSIFIYNLSGKFVSKISEIGKGPGEFLEFWDIALVPMKKQLALLDLKGRKINFYSYEGKFLSYKRIPFLFTEFSYIDTGTIAYYTGHASNKLVPEIDKHMLVVATDKDEVLSKAFPLSQNQINGSFNFGTIRSLWRYGNQVFFNSLFTDTLYSFNRNTMYPAYHINWGKTLPGNLLENIDDKRFEEIIKEYAYLNGDFVDFNDYLYMAMHTPTGCCYVFYSKITGKTVSFNYIFNSKATFGNNPFYSFFNFPITGFKNTLVVVKRSLDLIYDKKFGKNKSWENNKKMQELYKDLKEDDNPVLFFFPLKHF